MNMRYDTLNNKPTELHLWKTNPDANFFSTSLPATLSISFMQFLGPNIFFNNIFSLASHIFLSTSQCTTRLKLHFKASYLKWSRKIFLVWLFHQDNKCKNRYRGPFECFNVTVRVSDLGINYLIHFTLNIWFIQTQSKLYLLLVFTF